MLFSGISVTVIDTMLFALLLIAVYRILREELEHAGLLERRKKQ